MTAKEIVIRVYVKPDPTWLQHQEHEDLLEGFKVLFDNALGFRGDVTRVGILYRGTKEA